MFARPDYVFKDGRLVVRGGTLVDTAWGATHVVRPAFDHGIERTLGEYFERFQTIRLGNFAVGDGEIEDGGRARLIKHATTAGAAP
jgi:formylmethanofuran dehydrogenase subunit A